MTLTAEEDGDGEDWEDCMRERVESYNGDGDGGGGG